jgi:riboflavin synthase alpha subunit
VKEVIASGSNMSFWIESPISAELKTDQSVCHDGVCLTAELVKEKTRVNIEFNIAGKYLLRSLSLSSVLLQRKRNKLTHSITDEPRH